MLSRKQIRTLRAALVVAVVAISYLAFMPKPLDIDVSDKVEHACAFFSLALLTDFAFPASDYGWRKILALIGYGILIEIVQHFIPSRSSEVLDVVADTVGLLVYALVLPGLRLLPVLRNRWREGA